MYPLLCKVLWEIAKSKIKCKIWGLFVFWYGRVDLVNSDVQRKHSLFSVIFIRLESPHYLFSFIGRC